MILEDEVKDMIFAYGYLYNSDESPRAIGYDCIGCICKFSLTH